MPIDVHIEGRRLITCEHNGCVEALSSMQRDAEVTPKCLLRSIVIRKKKDSLERALEAKEKRGGKKGGEKRESRESDHSGLDRHLIITEQCL